MPEPADLREIWIYLAAEPLTGLTLTLVAYLAGLAIYRAVRLHPFANPVLLAVIAIVGLLHLTDTAYENYFAGAQFVHFMLGPATVALAVPLYRQFHLVRRSALALAVSLLAGAVTAIVSATAIAWALGATRETVLSLAPKSVTTPVAMGIAEQLGGLPSLTAVLVILSGILGAVAVTFVLNALGISDWRVRGFAAGVAAHGIGTARAFNVHPVAGAFASLAMGLNALATALLLPFLFQLLQLM